LIPALEAPRQRIASPIRRFGGKGQLAAKLLALLPPHTCYVEPFGGGAAVLFAKGACGVETYNDLDGALVDLFRVLADPAEFTAFWRRVIMLPYSRRLFLTCRDTWREQPDRMERVVRWWIVNRQCFGAVLSSYGSSVGASNRGMAQTCSAWDGILQTLPAIHLRLRRVQLECQDWRVILARYQGPGYLAYVDPPYVAETRRSGGYECELTDADHRDLVTALLAYDGAVVLSGYPSSMYAPLEAAGWERTEIPWACRISGGSRSSARVPKAQRARTEVVWRNPEAMRRLAAGVAR
jgi:DNA adenine methylase